jgi:hypothetical protein
LKNILEKISIASPNTPTSTSTMPGCLIENSHQSPMIEIGIETTAADNSKKRHIEKIDAVAPFILRGALIVLLLLQFIRFFIKK